MELPGIELGAETVVEQVKQGFPCVVLHEIA